MRNSSNRISKHALWSACSVKQLENITFLVIRTIKMVEHPVKKLVRQTDEPTCQLNSHRRLFGCLMRPSAAVTVDWDESNHF